MGCWLRYVLAALLVMVSSAQAGEIYKCINAQGHKVFSQDPCPDATVTGQDLQHRVWRQMRALVAEGKKISTNVQGDIASIQQCQKTSADFIVRVDALKDDIRAVQNKHPDLRQAYDQLHECAQCRFGAIAACEKAELSLNRAMNRLY